MNNNNDVELFRVRKSWDDIYSQTGAFFLFENALKQAKEKGLNVYNSSKKCVWNYKEELLCLK